MERIIERTINGQSYKLKLSEPTVYVDNKSRGRSGHMSHAMCEFSPGRFINFNSNCSNVRLEGHAAYGWIEYRFSNDCGKTYSDVYELEFAKKAFLDGLFTISVERVASARENCLTAFCLRNTMLEVVCCEPWLTPMIINSHDGGKTWSQPYEMCKYRGRVYGSAVYDGVIYALIYCNDAEEFFVGSKPEHVYRLYRSCDNGESFEEVCVVPVEGIGRAYGTMLFDEDGTLHVITYHHPDSHCCDHLVSRDFGKSWETLPCYLDKGIRNPQLGKVDGIYILHGRASVVKQTSGKGHVVYTSFDGITWDEGELLEAEKEACYYSSNISLCDNGKNKLLIQYSDAYERYAVNAMHMYIERI